MLSREYETSISPMQSLYQYTYVYVYDKNKNPTFKYSGFIYVTYKIQMHRPEVL